MNGDVFLDILFKKLRVRSKPAVSVPKIELKDPGDILDGVKRNYYAVDGGGGVIKLEGGRSLYVVRAVAVSKDDIIRDLDAEISYWYGKPILEAMRSWVELETASRAPIDLTVVDGSYYTMVVKWVTRVLRIALMRAKLSEIVSLPFTLRALKALEELTSKKEVVFISKNPSFRIFKNYYVLKKLYEETGEERYYSLMKDPSVIKKDLIYQAKREDLRDYVLLLLNSAVTDLDLLEGEGFSNALELPLPRQLRKFAPSLKWAEVVKMAKEYYEMSVGEDLDEPHPNLCNFKVPFIWWYKKGNTALAIEEVGGRSICSSSSIKEWETFPKLAPKVMGKEGDYPPLLEIAHALSTLSSSQLMSYASLISSVLDIKMESLREELISLSKPK